MKFSFFNRGPKPGEGNESAREVQESAPKIVKKIICVRHDDKDSGPDMEIAQSRAVANGYTDDTVVPFDVSDDTVYDANFNGGAGNAAELPAKKPADANETSMMTAGEKYVASLPRDDADRMTSLKPEGLIHALKRKAGFVLDGFKTKVLYSGRVRAGQTATMIASDVSEAGGAVSRTDVLENGNVGDGVDSRLDFNFTDPTFKNLTEGENRLFDAYKNGTLLKWIVEKSDDMSGIDRKIGDFPTAYSQTAARVASLLLEHMNPNSGEKEALIMGSHQGVFESFLAKVIEKTAGINKRDAFVGVLGGNGFDFAEGFEIDVMANTDSVSGGPHALHIRFKKGDFVFDKVVNAELLSEIVEDGRIMGETDL